MSRAAEAGMGLSFRTCSTGSASVEEDAVGLAARRFALLSLSKKCAVVALACIHGRAWPCISGGSCALVSILASCLEGARAPGVSKVATTGRWSEAAEPVNSVGSSLTVFQCHGEFLRVGLRWRGGRGRFGLYSRGGCEEYAKRCRMGVGVYSAHPRGVLYVYFCVFDAVEVASDYGVFGQKLAVF
eukprot:scaffold237_cov117-Isochrysis_galbana.AAC.9